jgi:hypothetical protein
MPTIDREYLMEDWGSYLGNSAYTPESTKQLFKGSGYSRSYDDALDDISTALQSGDYGYPEPQHEAAYHEILDEDDWKEIAREVIDAHLEEDYFMELLWEWGEAYSEIEEIASMAVWGDSPYWQIAYQLGSHVLDDIFSIFDVKGDEGVTGAYDKVIPLPKDVERDLEALRLFQMLPNKDEKNIIQIQDMRRKICDGLLAVYK